MSSKKSAKRKSDAGGAQDLDSKRAKTRDANLKLYEKMKLEADEKKKKTAEKKAKEEKLITKSRRQTITPVRSSHTLKSNKKPARQSLAPPKTQPKPTRKSLTAVELPIHRVTNANKKSTLVQKATPERRKSLNPPASSVSSDEHSSASSSSSEEDEFDRLVQSDSRRSSSSSTNEYKKVYSVPSSSRPPSKRQLAYLKRKQEKEANEQRGYRSSDDSESEEEEESEGEEPEEKVREVVKHHFSPATRAAAVTTVHAGNQSKDPMMMTIDSILLSIVVFFLGFLLVIGLFYTLTSLDLNNTFTSLFGTTFTGLSGTIQFMAKNVVRLAIAGVLIFVSFEIYMWINRRANSRREVVSQLAKEAKSILKLKKANIYPSAFIMEEVLEECNKLTLNDVKIDRSMIKTLWPDVEVHLLEDVRLQSSDHEFDGKKRRCLRYSSGLPSAGSSIPPPATGQPPRGSFRML